MMTLPGHALGNSIFSVIMDFILIACSNSIQLFTWQEEVKLNDGGVIIVSQKKSCESAIQTKDGFGCIARESWLTINLTEFSPSPILWNEKLHPRIVNVHNERLYIVAHAPTDRESRLYGIYATPAPPYIGFIWGEGKWVRLSFDKIPQSIYSTNMLIEEIPPKDCKTLTLELKNDLRVNGNAMYGRHQKYIDPKYIEQTIPQRRS
jgi:hypothetical protein